MSDEFGFQLMKQMLATLPDRTIIFKDLEGKTDTVLVKELYLNTVSQFKYDSEVILVPLPSK